MWRDGGGGRVLWAVQFKKVFRPIRHGQSPGPSSFLRLHRATSVVAVAPTQVDSGRFSVLVDDLSDTDVDEGGVEALSLPAVDESSNLERVPSEVNVMSDAEGPTVGQFGVGVSTGGRTQQ